MCVSVVCVPVCVLCVCVCVCACVCTVFPALWGPNVPTGIVITVNFDLVGTFILFP